MDSPLRRLKVNRLRCYCFIAICFLYLTELATLSVVGEIRLRERADSHANALYCCLLKDAILLRMITQEGLICLTLSQYFSHFILFLREKFVLKRRWIRYALAGRRW